MLLDTEGNEITEETEIPVDDHIPTDEELSDAFDNFIVDKPYAEPVITDVEDVHKEPETETPEKIAEKLRHSDESRLGRRLARVESMFEDLSKKILTKDDLVKLKETPVEEEIEDITNVEQLDKFVDKKIAEREARQARVNEENKNKYQDDYVVTMKELISDIPDEQTAKEVYKEMLYNGKFNVKLSNNSFMDASKNFAKAYNFVTSGKKGSRFDNDRRPGVPTGVSGASTTPGVFKKVLPKLSPDAEAFMKQTGMTEEEVIEALEGEMPLQLRGKVSA